MARTDRHGRTVPIAGDLRLPVRLVLVAVFIVLSGIGLWYGQCRDINALSPTPGVWPPWAFWPCLVALCLILTQLPRRWPKRLRQVGAVVALLAFLPTAVVADAAIGALAMEDHVGVVNADTAMRRSMHRVNVAVGDRALNAMSPAASFAGGQRRDSTTGNRHYEPGVPFTTDRPYERGERVLVRVDPDGELYARIIPTSGQSGYLPWFPRTETSSVVAGLLLALGWAWILTACVGVLVRRPLTSLDD